MHVKVILKDKGSAVETIQPDTTIADVIYRLKSRRIGVLVVSGNG